LKQLLFEVPFEHTPKLFSARRSVQLDSQLILLNLTASCQLARQQLLLEQAIQLLPN
jgi:hypothetical protein